MAPPPQRRLYLTNEKGRDATVLFATLKYKKPPAKGVPGHPVDFRRYLSTTQAGLHDAMQENVGEDYAQALIDGDPEVDMEHVGRRIGQTQQVYLSSTGDVLHAPPKVVEVIYETDGSEVERLEPVDRDGNVNDELPVRWTGKRMKKSDAVRRFVFGRTLGLAHQDGLTYDYLHGMAKDLAESGELVMMGAGEKGRDPLILQTNGTPYRGFLEGRLDGQRYLLLLHLSNMELKRPGEAK